MDKIAAYYRKFHRVVDALGIGAGLFGGIAVLGVMIIILVFIIQRSVFVEIWPGYRPWHFVDEYSGYVYVLVVYLALTYTLMTKGHIRMELVTSRLPPRLQAYMELGCIVITFFITVLFFRLSIEYIVAVIELHHLSETFTPMWIPYIPVMVGVVLFAFGLTVAAVDKVIEIRTQKGK